MAAPRVSVALATYNGARYLPEQLKSYTTQRRPPDELVVSDDASSDETMSLVDEFRAAAPFDVRVSRNRVNAGYPANFEAAIARCTGDVIFLSDQDDVWFPEKIETVMAVFEESPDTMVVTHDQIITKHDLTHHHVTKLSNLRRLGLHPSLFKTGCCTAFRRRWLDVVLPIPAEAVAHDLWICRLADLLGVRRILETPLIYYRRHGGNASKWDASDPNGASAFAAFRRYAFRDARSGWAREAGSRRACIARLRDRAGVVRGLGREAAANASIDRLNAEIDAIERRTLVVSRPRWARGPHVLRFLIDGEYRHFRGWRSAAKDLVRP